MPYDSCVPCCDPSATARGNETLRYAIVLNLCRIAQALTYGGPATEPIQTVDIESVAVGAPVNVVFPAPGVKRVTITNGGPTADPLTVTYTIPTLTGPFTANLVGGQTYVFELPLGTADVITQVNLTRDAGGAAGNVTVLGFNPGTF